jgi:hypothetical protein
MPGVIQDVAFQSLRECLPRTTALQTAQILWALSKGRHWLSSGPRTVLFAQGHAQLLRCISRFPDRNVPGAPLPEVFAPFMESLALPKLPLWLFV